jgi:hypothetical protein
MLWQKVLVSKSSWKPNPAVMEVDNEFAGAARKCFEKSNQTSHASVDESGCGWLGVLAALLFPGADPCFQILFIRHVQADF